MSKKLVKIMSLMLAVVCVMSMLSACGDNSDTDDSASNTSATDNGATDSQPADTETGTIEFIDLSRHNEDTGETTTRLIKVKYDMPEDFEVDEHMGRDELGDELHFAVVHEAEVAQTDKDMLQFSICAPDDLYLGNMSFIRNDYAGDYESEEYSYTSATGVNYKIYATKEDNYGYIDYHAIADIGSSDVAVRFIIEREKPDDKGFYTILDVFNFALGVPDGDTVNFPEYIGKTETNPEEIKHKLTIAYSDYGKIGADGVVNISYHDENTGKDMTVPVKVKYDMPENYRIRGYQVISGSSINLGSADKTGREYAKIRITRYLEKYDASEYVMDISFGKKDNAVDDYFYELIENYTSATGINYKVYAEEGLGYLFVADIGSPDIVVTFSVKPQEFSDKRFYTIIDAFNFALGVPDGDTVNFPEYAGKTEIDPEDIKNKITDAYPPLR